MSRLLDIFLLNARQFASFSILPNPYRDLLRVLPENFGFLEYFSMILGEVAGLTCILAMGKIAKYALLERLFRDKINSPPKLLQLPYIFGWIPLLIFDIFVCAAVFLSSAKSEKFPKKTFIYVILIRITTNIASQYFKIL